MQVVIVPNPKVDLIRRLVDYPASTLKLLPYIIEQIKYDELEAVIKELKEDLIDFQLLIDKGETKHKITNEKTLLNYLQTQYRCRHGQKRTQDLIHLISKTVSLEKLAVHFHDMQALFDADRFIFDYLKQPTRSKAAQALMTT